MTKYSKQYLEQLARARARELERQRENFRRNPSAPLPQYDGELKLLQEQHKAELEEVREDDTLAEDYKRDRLREIEREHKQERDAEVRRAFAAMSEDREYLTGITRRVRPVGTLEQETLRELMLQRKDRELRDEIEANGGKPTLVMYESLVEGGDELTIEAFETMYRRYLKGPENHVERVKLEAAVQERREAAMSPSQRSAQEGLRQLEAKWDDLAFGLHLADQMPAGIPDASATPRSPSGLVAPQREA